MPPAWPPTPFPANGKAPASYCQQGRISYSLQLSIF
nr:MAG TPA: hypothetical protein [Bacteriophage sp.]